MVARGFKEPIKIRYFSFRNYVIAFLFGPARVLGDYVGKPIIVHAAPSLSESLLFFNLFFFFFFSSLFFPFRSDSIRGWYTIRRGMGVPRESIRNDCFSSVLFLLGREENEPQH
jgi:hypothetical protein